MTTVCVRCGSIRTRLIRGNPLEWVCALVLRQDVVVCGRCGYRGRQRRAKVAALSGTAASRREPSGAALPLDRARPDVDLQALDRSVAGVDPPGGAGTS